MSFPQVVQQLEARGIMPKTGPGLEKIRHAVTQAKWFPQLDPKKIVTVAGTNGKGTTSACLESLLMSAGKKVGLYTSPHLVKTNERIRINQIDISENTFVDLYLKNVSLFDRCQLSHFECLTFMAADYFFSTEYSQNLDFVILEVGLGGLFDATNIFPNHYSIITRLGLDHIDLLGSDLKSIAKNKFGIVKNNSIVVHYPLDKEVLEVKEKTRDQTKSRWLESDRLISFRINEDTFQTQVDSSAFGTFAINLTGERVAKNCLVALTMFSEMGFETTKHLAALKNIKWPGRFQKVNVSEFNFPLVLSGDHNPQGLESLLNILKGLNFKNIHFIVGIGKDKNCEEMLRMIIGFPRAKLYLTETPFKGKRLEEYPDWALDLSIERDANIFNLLGKINSLDLSGKDDLFVVSGSLYLVGQVLGKMK